MESSIDIIFYSNSGYRGYRKTILSLMKNLNKKKYNVFIFPIFLKGKLKEEFHNSNLNILFPNHKIFIIRNLLMLKNNFSEKIYSAFFSSTTLFNVRTYFNNEETCFNYE